MLSVRMFGLLGGTGAERPKSLAVKPFTPDVAACATELVALVTPAVAWWPGWVTPPIIPTCCWLWLCCGGLLYWLLCWLFCWLWEPPVTLLSKLLPPPSSPPPPNSPPAPSRPPVLDPSMSWNKYVLFGTNQEQVIMFYCFIRTMFSLSMWKQWFCIRRKKKSDSRQEATANINLCKWSYNIMFLTYIYQSLNTNKQLKENITCSVRNIGL